MTPTILFTEHGQRYAAIPRFPGYAIGENGLVLSNWQPRHAILSDRWRPLSPGVNSKGYLQVALYVNGQRSYRLVQRLVLEAFVGPCPAGLEACHANHKRWDNRLDNLSWGTRSRNADEREQRRRERK